MGCYNLIIGHCHHTVCKTIGKSTWMWVWREHVFSLMCMQPALIFSPGFLPLCCHQRGGMRFAFWFRLLLIGLNFHPICRNRCSEIAQTSLVAHGKKKKKNHQRADFTACLHASSVSNKARSVSTVLDRLAVWALYAMSPMFDLLPRLLHFLKTALNLVKSERNNRALPNNSFL